MALKNIIELLDSDNVTIIYRDFGYDNFSVGICKNFTDDFLNSKVCSMAASVNENGEPRLNIWVDRDK